MKKLIKILTFNNEVEARLIEGILKDRNISFIIRTYSDSAYDGLWQLQSGWGHLEAMEADEEEILRIYKDITSE